MIKWIREKNWKLFENKMSNEISWNIESENFSLMNHAWNVGKAKELIINSKPRKIEDMEIEGLTGMIGSPGKMTSGINVDWNVAKNADMSIPVILIPYNGSYLPIDGWHRIGRAKIEGIKSLPAVLLTKKEAKLIEIK